LLLFADALKAAPADLLHAAWRTFGLGAILGPPMPTPIWLDAAGHPRPTRPCPRCGVPVPMGIELSLEAARALGWMPCQTVRVVWCGHGTELLPSPWGLLPVMENAAD
jgi:hypothetical protein